MFKHVGHICTLSNPTIIFKCLYKWWLFWLNTTWLISCRSSKSLARTLPRETQRTDIWKSSDWCFDTISLHSNEKIREIQGSCFNKVGNVDTISSFLTIPFLILWSPKLPSGPYPRRHGPQTVCCAQKKCFKHTIKTKILPPRQGRNDGGQGGHNSPGTESLWRRRMIVRAPKSPNTVTSTFYNTVHLVSQDLRFEHRGRQICFLPRAPPHLVTPLLLQNFIFPPKL